MLELGEYHEYQIQRRLAKIDKGEHKGCWFWLGSYDGRLQGEYWLNGRYEQATRLVYFLTTGHQLEPWIRIKRTCGHPVCVAPAHFKLTTPVTAVEVARIRLMAGLEYSTKAIAEAVGRSRRTVQRVLKDGRVA